MKEYLLGIDLGTSGTKTVLFRSDGTAMAAHTVEYPLYQPQNGWAEQEPSDWWRAVRETVQAVLHKSGVAAADVAGVGISGQMHGLVMLDERGEVLHRSILWCDGRTGEECREITETVGAEKLIAITANPALAGFTAGKILWVRKHLPEVYKACRHILLPKDYIRYCLTGQFATEVSDASGMNLLDVPRRQWSDEILNKLDIDPALLGRMYESVDVTGTVTAEAAALTGGQSVSDACAALDAQILTLTVQVQQKDNEIVQLEQQLDTAAPEEQDGIRAEIESKKAEQAAVQTQLDTATSQRAALDGYKSDESTLSTTQTALRNATVLLKARQEAEASLNESTE